jgi:hypothetical protein
MQRSAQALQESNDRRGLSFDNRFHHHFAFRVQATTVVQVAPNILVALPLNAPFRVQRVNVE